MANPEPVPVDNARLAKLRVAAALVLLHDDRHTPLELRWAQQVLDLATALQAARSEMEEGSPGGRATT
jgi:hypothetical protein